MSNVKRPSGSSPQQPRSTSRATPVVVAIAVVVCIVAVVAIKALAGGDGATAPSAGRDSTALPSGGDSTSGGPSTGPVSCTETPSPPADVLSFDQAPDPALAQDATWVATVATNCGDVIMELNGDAAPQTVASFIFLSQEGYFDDSPCHRLVTSGIFVLQCGDPTGTGGGDPGYRYGMENAPTDGTYPRGTLAMARTADPESNGSQFFVVYKKSSIPDPTGYSIFGRVSQGLEIIDIIADKGVEGGGGDGAPAQPVSILSVSLQKKS